MHSRLSYKGKSCSQNQLTQENAARARNWEGVNLQCESCGVVQTKIRYVRSESRPK